MTVGSNDGGRSTYFSVEEADAFYMLLAAPEAMPSTDQVVPKRMVFVFDRSGSMEGEKIEQARAALRFAVESLNEGDEFNIVDYGTTVRSFRGEAATIDSETRVQALEYVDSIEAVGGTNIHDALTRALEMMRDDDRAEMVVFLTDGKPTIGETNSEQILQDLSEENSTAARIFVFGVGHEVNTLLLDRVAGDHGGTTSYVKPGEDIEASVSAFYSKVSSPVLADLTVSFDGVTPHDFYPRELPDLFRGGQIVQLGRLGGHGPVTVELSGQLMGEQLAFVRSIDVEPSSGASGSEFLPRLWATRKVGFLLGQIRQNGEDDELVDEIVSLSKEYGIITPYTSFLIIEDDPPVPIAEDPILRAESGADAVAASEDVSSYAGAGNTNEVRSQEVRYVGDRTFFLREGFWEDTRFDFHAPTRTLRYGSDAYFELLAEYPVLGRFLALGRNVLIAHGDEQFRIGESLIATNVEEERQVSVPEAAQLDQNFPNPFNSSTTISYELRSAGEVHLELFDLTGQRIRILVSMELLPGYYEARWDGLETGGASAASGTYIVRLTTAQGSQERKVLLIK